MITEEEVLKIASLAKLSLNEEEVTLFSHQLGDILNYVEQLNKLDTENVQPTTRAISTTNIFRDDEVKQDYTVEEILSNAPEREDNLFKVPKI